MKKKFVSLLILACAVVGMGLVGSCNDYADDMVRDLELSQDKNSREFNDSLVSVKNLINKNYNTLNNYYNQLKNRVDSLQSLTDTATVWKAIRELGDVCDSLAAVTDTLNYGQLNKLNQQISQAAASAQAALGKADSAYDLADSIRTAIVGWDSKLQAAYDSAALAYALAFRDSIRIDALELSLADYATYDSVYSIAKENLATAKAYTDLVSRQVADSVGNVLNTTIRKLGRDLERLTRKVDNLKNLLTTLQAAVQKNIEDIAALDQKLLALEDKLKNVEVKRISSLLVQGAKTPAFGSFSLPVGIRSNLLMAYYGEFDAVIDFPTTATAHLISGDIQISATEEALLGFASEKYSAGTVINDVNDNAGKLYLTVNPNNVALDNTYEFKIVNSLGQESKAVLGNLRPSTDKLTFGYSTKAGVDSADTENGFYEADVKINAADVDALKPSIDKEALKTIAKDLKNFKSGVNLSNITQSVLTAFNEVLDANAIQVTWSDSLGTHQVRSGYDLAIAAVKPLSYHTSISGFLPAKLPVDPIGDLLASIKKPKFTLNLGTLDLSAHSITFTDITYTPSDGSFINAQVKDTAGVVIGTASVNISNLQSDIDKLVTDVNGSVNGAETQIAALIDSIEAQVNNILTPLEAQVEDNIGEIIDDIKTQVGSSAMVSRVNSLINRINGIIDNADNLFDITLLYYGKDKQYHPASANAGVPSPFNGVATYTLYPTSFNAELLAPAYKKFIAVTDVINNVSRVSAKGGDEGCKAILQDTNSSADFNTVLEGNVASVEFKPTTAGYTYEILYSAIDYQGWISTRRFYVTVK
jgi:polyhydroxyalkanoate synthesis regulator phasin